MRKAPHNQARTHLMRKTIFHKLRKGKRQVPQLHLSTRARVAEPRATRELPRKRPCAGQVPAGKTDQSMIEAARCMFHKLLGEVKDDLDRVTPQSQEGLSTEIRQNKRRCSRTVMLKVDPCPCPEESSDKSVHQKSVNRNASAAIFSRDTSASYRGGSSEAARVVGTSKKDPGE